MTAHKFENSGCTPMLFIFTCFAGTVVKSTTCNKLMLHFLSNEREKRTMLGTCVCKSCLSKVTCMCLHHVRWGAYTFRKFVHFCVYPGWFWNFEREYSYSPQGRINICAFVKSAESWRKSYFGVVLNFHEASLNSKTVCNGLCRFRTWTCGLFTRSKTSPHWFFGTVQYLPQVLTPSQNLGNLRCFASNSLSDFCVPSLETMAELLLPILRAGGDECW